MRGKERGGERREGGERERGRGRERRDHSYVSKLCTGTSFCFASGCCCVLTSVCLHRPISGDNDPFDTAWHDHVCGVAHEPLIVLCTQCTNLILLFCTSRSIQGSNSHTPHDTACFA